MEINTKEDLAKAIKKDGLALEFASDEMKNDKEIVLKAIKKDWLALKFASNKLKDDKEVVLEAVKHYGLALIFASRRLQTEFKEKGIKKIEKEIREAKTDKKSTIKPVKQSNFKIKTNKK